MKRGVLASTTGNLTAVLDHLLTEKTEHYKAKLESKHEHNNLKRDQLYNLVYHLTKQRVVSAVPGRMTPGRIKIESDDELNHTETQSSAQKAVQSKTLEVHRELDVEASSEHEESESVGQAENITIFAPGEVFGEKQPQAVGRGPAIIQDESENEEMEQADEPGQKPETEEAQVSQIINAFNFASVFKAKAYKTENIKVLKRALKKHLKEAAMIKKILRKLGQRVHADSDSDDSAGQ